MSWVVMEGQVPPGAPLSSDSTLVPEAPSTDLFVDSEGRPALVNCAVLFIDVLGVSEMSRDHEANTQLRRLSEAVRSAYRDFLANDSPWPAAYFSDTFVLAAPVGSEAGADGAAVAEIVYHAAWLQLNLLDRGFFVRGAITLGPFHIGGGFIFGPALVEAHELEKSTALHPRIVLGADAETAQRNAAEDSDKEVSPPLLCDNDGRLFVDYMRVLLEDPKSPISALERYREIVMRQLREHRAKREIWEKYRWVGEYHNQKLESQPDNIAALRVPADLITRRFLPMTGA
jgi:hypothetical protein